MFLSVQLDWRTQSREIFRSGSNIFHLIKDSLWFPQAVFFYFTEVFRLF